MARPNYNAVKRQKELKRKAKREAKLAKRHARKAEQEGGGPSSDVSVPGGVAGAPDAGPSDPGVGQAEDPRHGEPAGPA